MKMADVHSSDSLQTTSNYHQWMIYDERAQDVQAAQRLPRLE
jgi:hypothetical protein